MVSPPEFFVVVACIVIGVVIADHPLIQDNSSSSGGEVLLLEFPGHPAARCGYRSHPEPVSVGPSLRFTVLQRGEDGRSVRDTYYCTLAGGEAEFKHLVEDNLLVVRREHLTDAEPTVELGRVHCVLQPSGTVPAGVFDFRATRLSSGLPPFLCLRLDANRTLTDPLAQVAAPPERDALVFRFNRANVPDLLCRPFSDVPLAESDIEVEVFGVLHPASGPLNCHFRRVYEGQSTAELLSRLSQEMHAKLVVRRDLPPMLTLPSFTCHAARRADQPAPPADDLSSSSQSSSSSPPAFTVTGPSSRWALCWMSPEHALEDVAIDFPNIPRVICRSQEVYAVPSLKGTEFYFILQLGSSSRLQCRIAGLLKSESDLDSRLDKVLETTTRQTEVTLRSEGGVPVLETPPATCVDPLAYPTTALPDGVVFIYSVRGKDLRCALAKRGATSV